MDVSEDTPGPVGGRAAATVPVHERVPADADPSPFGRVAAHPTDSCGPAENLGSMSDDDAGPTVPEDTDSADEMGDTFGVGIHVTSDEFRFVVHVPSDIDAGWRDPDAFQRLIEVATWDRLDQQETLRAVARTTAEGETVTLGTVTMRPGGGVIDHSLAPPEE